jgi:hypothetical protein
VAIAGDTDIHMIPTSIVNCMIGVGHSTEELIWTANREAPIHETES